MMTRTFEVTCDHCATRAEAAEMSSEAKDLAADGGFHRYEGHDICPTCWAEGWRPFVARHDRTPQPLGAKGESKPKGPKGNKPAPAVDAAVRPEDMTVPMLKSALKAKDLPVGGKKDELLERLLAA